jgi:YD repeat-containing protein
MPDTYIFTGLQSFWNYDSFSIAGRMIGGGTGYINTSGAKWLVTPSGTPKNPATPPTVSVDEDMNFMFSTTDIVLKFQNNSPFVRRFYNSTERHHTGSGNTCDSLPRHMGLAGRHWILNYEQCFIATTSPGSNSVKEIGPTGERNAWGTCDGSGDFTSPKGIQKKLKYNSSDNSFDLTTPDYMTYHFDKHDLVPGSASPSYYYHRLSYIEDRHGVRQYVEWENKSTGYGSPVIERYRIKQVSVSTDQGDKKTPLIKFRYTSWEDSGNTDAFHLIRTMQDTAGNEWRFQYDFDTATADIGARLTKVTYPDGYSQAYTYTNDWAVGSPTKDDLVLTKITDRKGTDWEIGYDSGYWRIDNSETSTSDYHTTSFVWSIDSASCRLPSGLVASGSGYSTASAYRTVKCVRTDAESKDWTLLHNCLHGPGNVGNLMRRADPAGKKWWFYWDDPASDQTIDNLVYLTALPKVATNADTVQRTEYTSTGNAFKLVSKTYPMRGTDPNYGVKGSIESAQYVQYTYTSGQSTVAQIDYHKDYSTAAYVGDVEASPGIGKDDLTAQGTFTGTSDEQFTVTITTSGTPDTFSWTSSQGGSGSNVSITGSAQTLRNGVTVRFGATTGHTVGDTWTFTASAARTAFFARTEHEYDDNHNLVKTVSGVNPDAPPDDRREHLSLDLTTYMEYDAFGNLIRSTDARGNSSSYYYNQFGAMERSMNPLGGVTTQTWDEMSIRLQATTDASGTTVRYSYDPLGQVIAVRDTAGNVSKTQYDPNGNVIGRADAKGHSGRMVFDRKNRLASTMSPSGVLRELTLSKTGQLLLEKTTYWDTDYATNEQVVYRRTFYNDSGRVTSRSLPSATDHGSTESIWEQNNALAAKYTYDDNGNVLTTVDRYGQTTTNTYTWADQLETTQPPNIPDTTSGEFIRTTNKTIYGGPMGRVSEEQVQEETSSNSGANWSITRAYYFVKKHTYDRASRTIVVELPTHTINGSSYYAYQVTWYDPNGNVTEKQLKQVNQSDATDTATFPSYVEYDLANRVVKESKLVSTETDKYDRIESTFEYGPDGRRTSVNRGGLVVQLSYNSAGQVSEVRKGSPGCGCGGGCGATASPATVSQAQEADLPIWRRYEYDAAGNRIAYSDPAGVFASATHDAENRPVATTDRAGRVTRREYWAAGQLKREIRPDGSFTGYEYDIEGRMTKVWASVPERNSSQAAGPFGGSKDVALVKTIEYYRGTAMPSGSGQTITWAGTQIASGTYVSAVRTFTYKDVNGNYDMVYTSNARGQAEITKFIDADDSTTRTTTRYYTWRDRVRRVTHADGNYLDYEYDDHLRVTKEKLDGNNEYYQYEYCLCGPVKRHKYHYLDSLSNAQTMEWVNTVDKLGRMMKEYYPYAIGKHGSDEYHSILYEHDRANRRELMSNPVWGHICADTSGWTNHVEDEEEHAWIFDEPQVYRYGAQGNLEAVGRVKGNEIMAGQGEPYFVERDGAGRMSQVVYPDSGGLPEFAHRYEYGQDGRLKETALVSTKNAPTGTYGPEKYVVQFQHDVMGRLVRKVVRDNTASDVTRYEFTYEFDGRGQQTREKIMAWDGTAGVERMVVKQDIVTNYDLGGNPTQIKFYDNLGLAYTETRTYARGYQLTGASFSDLGTSVTVNTSGSYTYDTNNNMTGTKEVDATRSTTQLSYRGDWTFTYDRKNRLKTHTNSNANNKQGNLWYDGLGRVWQRWNYDTGQSSWDGTLTRFVYDGSQLVQEHTSSANQQVGQWVYTYPDISRDYMHHPAGLRQREGTATSYTDHYLQSNAGSIEYKTQRDAVSETLARNDRSASLDRFPGATFDNISHLATSGQYIESYGGGTTGDSKGFDAFVHRGSSHYLTALGRFTSGHGNYLLDDIASGGEELRRADEIWPFRVGSSDNGYFASWDFCSGTFGLCCQMFLAGIPLPPECITKIQGIGLPPFDPYLRYLLGWFPWCCLPDCVRRAVGGIPVDPCPDEVWPDCGCSCCWATQEAIKAGSLNVIWDDPTCFSKGIEWKPYILDAIQVMCGWITSCACRIYRMELAGVFDAGFGEAGRASFLDFWGCMFNLCSGVNSIRIDCSPGWSECWSNSQGYYRGGPHDRLPGGTAWIALCINNWSVNEWHGWAVIHELMHHCGGTGHAKGFPNIIIDQCWVESIGNPGLAIYVQQNTDDPMGRLGLEGLITCI